eukprot:TRINITY_DN32586_c0_g1_i1.p1 TRINITY_DN32586_c0_g1~~TRINITY_DN32586_c0_g1_i1.p1  ORF type:complete len:1061 (-),score=177.72 TRINITY_DN32586_c0_g1_i1:218-3400(-)
MSFTNEQEDADVFEGQEEIVNVEETATDALCAVINVHSLEEIKMADSWVTGTQESWATYLSAASSREAAGDAIYAAIYESSAALQPLFTTPRAVQAMKFLEGINALVNSLSNPAGLKVFVETLGFGHLVWDVTVPRVVLFRDALLDMFQMELGIKLNAAAARGWHGLLNYVGGGIIFIRTFYADRIRLLGESWTLANDKHYNKETFTMGSSELINVDNKASNEETLAENNVGQSVPTTFNEMFQFNSAIMGFGTSTWMTEVLACFDNIVKNVSNTPRLHEEVDFLVCRIGKVTSGKVNLGEFKSCMLASLRSLLPKDWTTQHEVAWSWLWENVEQTLMKNLGKPEKWSRAYSRFLDGLDEATGFQLRADIYLTFFSLAPAGQDHFKQSNTYLHLISTKVLMLVLDVYRDPVKTIDDVSGMGLRHVGYAIPTEFMPPFASACVEVINGLTNDQLCIDGFQWSINLVAKSMVRTIQEGSTIVMKSINQNNRKGTQRALANAPRGERMKWMLLVQVGSQDISPLGWAIMSGSLNSASVMLKDLLTFRADRDRYYYSADDLFKRHPDIVSMLFANAPGLLPVLLDGLVWRSRIAVAGMRRVNYFIKHLVVDQEGSFSQTLYWVAKAEDPKIVCHPALVFLADLVWTQLASRYFVIRKVLFFFTLLCFLTSQSILPHIREVRGFTSFGERVLMFSVRVFLYVFSMGANIVYHLGKSVKAYRARKTFRLFRGILVPKYLTNWQEMLTFCLAAIMFLMMVTDPILYCLADDDGALFTDICAASEQVFTLNAFLSMIASFVYYGLLADLAVFDNRVSAYILAIHRLLSEVALFIISLLFFILAWSSAMCCLHAPPPEFANLSTSMLSFFEAYFEIFSEERILIIRDTSPVLYAGFFVFLLITLFFTSSLLVAQLSCSYGSIFEDMLGFARLKRVRVILDAMPAVPERRFKHFVTARNFNQRIEFNEGDVGLANGIAATEPASAHPTSVDSIRRFGGSTSPDIQWPEESIDDGFDKFDRIETLLKRLSSSSKKERRRGTSSTNHISGEPGEDSIAAASSHGADGAESEE